MSHEIEERYSVYRETLRCARKSHTCDACGETIQPRHRYYSVAAVFQGEVESVKRCMRCQAIHVHLRTLDPGEVWPDEALNCGTDYEDEWGDLPDDVARLAFLSQDEAQTLSRETRDRTDPPRRTGGCAVPTRKSIVAFPAHGQFKARVSEICAATEEKT